MYEKEKKFGYVQDDRSLWTRFNKRVYAKRFMRIVSNSFEDKLKK